MKKLLLKKALKGFTLIELIIVIVILGVLIAAAIPKYKDMQFDSQQSATFGSLASFRSATSIWVAKASDHGPPMIVAAGANGTVCAVCNGGTDPEDGTIDINFFPSYIQRIPKNDIYDDFASGTTADASEITVYTSAGASILSNTAAWLGSSTCGTSRASTGKIDEATGWVYAAEPTSGSGGGGEGFDWRINLQDCIPGTSTGYYEK